MSGLQHGPVLLSRGVQDVGHVQAQLLAQELRCDLQERLPRCVFIRLRRLLLNLRLSWNQHSERRVPSPVLLKVRMDDTHVPEPYKLPIYSETSQLQGGSSSNLPTTRNLSSKHCSFKIAYSEYAINVSFMYFVFATFNVRSYLRGKCLQYHQNTEI